MSGGHYNYCQWHLGNIADLMEEDIARIGTKGEYDDGPYGMEDSAKAALRLAIALLRASSDLVHDVDWCMSGDTGDDTLRRDLYKFAEKHELALERAIDNALQYMEAPKAAP